ncbi:hypothetical protein PHET_01986 [Paragonimus heterotremus]|uniref:Uncharacterized protein n=1 Tax=Paragonimus heterotremus TaxID=100268 RepID=A0A8J4TLZ4_9TREM|nr:hypothetical protein PHET_01986 [Paragonimus heterotremus]
MKIFPAFSKFQKIASGTQINKCRILTVLLSQLEETDSKRDCLVYLKTNYSMDCRTEWNIGKFNHSLFIMYVKPRFRSKCDAGIMDSVCLF